MAKHVVINIKSLDLKVPGLKMVEPPNLSFKVEVELDKKMEAGAQKDPLLLQEFQAQAKEIQEMTVKTIKQKCQAYDKLFIGMANKGVSAKDMKKQIDGLNVAITNDVKVAEKAAEAGVEAAWKKLQGKKKEWKKFKIKVASSIGATVATTAVSIVAMATAPFSGGAGAVVAITGFCKSGIKLASDISKLAMDIETSKKILVKNLAVAEKAASNKALNATNEVSAAIFQEFLGISQPSVKTCGEAAETLSAKYAQMTVKVHDLSKVLNAILDKQEKLKKELLTEAASKLKKHPTTDKKGQLAKVKSNLDKALDGNYAKVDAQIQKVTALYAETRTWEKPVNDLTKRVKALEIKDPKALKVFREALKFAALGLSPIDGNSVATGAKELGLGVGGAVGGYAIDKIKGKMIDGTVFDAA